MLTKALLHNRISPTLNTTDLANKYVLNTKLVSRAVNFLMAMAMAGSGWSKPGAKQCDTHHVSCFVLKAPFFVGFPKLDHPVFHRSMPPAMMDRGASRGPSRRCSRRCWCGGSSALDDLMIGCLVMSGS